MARIVYALSGQGRGSTNLGTSEPEDLCTRVYGSEPAGTNNQRDLLAAPPTELCQADIVTEFKSAATENPLSWHGYIMPFVRINCA